MKIENKIRKRKEKKQQLCIPFEVLTEMRSFATATAIKIKNERYNCYVVPFVFVFRV